MATSRLRAQLNRTGWLLISPFLVGMVALVIIPILYALYISVFRQQIVGGITFVALKNYFQAFADQKLYFGIGTVALYFLIQVPIMTGAGLIAALAIDSGRLFFARMYRLVLFLPYTIPGVVAILMWNFMYSPSLGPLRDLNHLLGWNITTLYSPNTILLVISNISIWIYAGYQMLIFYAALRSIPSEIYEAARLDGAGEFRIALAIKLPALVPALSITLLFSLIGSFQLFNEPTILQRIATVGIPTFFTPNMYANSLSFAGQQPNYAATISIIMGVLTTGLAVVAQRVTRRFNQGSGA